MDAERFGLVNQIVPADQLMTLVQQKAMQLAALPTEAVLLSKKLLRQPTQHLVQQVIHQELAVFEHLLQSDTCQQALQRFFARSK